MDSCYASAVGGKCPLAFDADTPRRFPVGTQVEASGCKIPATSKKRRHRRFTRRRDPNAADPVRDAQVYVQGGRKPTGRRVVEWAREAEARGAGEILLTSMDADGTRAGFDCELTAAVSEAVSIPVIASGGAGTVEHFGAVFAAGKADAALAASIFHFGVSSARSLKQELAKAGISVRLPC